MTSTRRVDAATTMWLVALAIILAACSSSTTTSTTSDDADEPSSTEVVRDVEPATSEPTSTTATSTPSTTTTTNGPTTTDEPFDEPVTQLNVAYFPEWPLPAQIGQEDGTFAEAVGVEQINWIPMVSSGEMTDAMLSGRVDISYSQGATSFADAVNSGAEITTVGIAVDYSPADVCIVQGGLGVTRANAAETLDGATVMTPFGNISHYKMLSTMQHLGVDIDSFDIIEAGSSADTTELFRAGQIDVGCVFGAPMFDMLDDGGSILMTTDEQAMELGIRTYDVISIPTRFGEDHREIVVNFLTAVEYFNVMWQDDPDTSNEIIAEAAGMQDVGDFMAGETWFSFPTAVDQRSSDWLGSGVALAMKNQVETLFLLAAGPQLNTDFAAAIDMTFITEVN